MLRRAISRGMGVRNMSGLSAETIATVKATIPVLETHGYKITTAMYRRMFEERKDIKALFNTEGHQSEIDGAPAHQPLSLACAVGAYAKYIDDLSVLGPAVERIAQKHCSLMIQPEHYPVVGTHLIAALKEVLGDAATPEIIKAWTEAYFFLADIFIGREKDIYNAGLITGWKDMVVKEKVLEGYGIVSLYLAPEDGSPLPSYSPGQYVGIRVEGVPGTECDFVQRNYSLSGRPGQDSFRITVKRQGPMTIDGPYGLMSYHIHDRLNVGDKIKVSNPCGDFFVNEKTEKPICLMSGGIGLTPIISMLEHLVETDVPNQIVYLNTVRTRAQQPWHQRLSELATSRLNLRIHNIYDSPPDPHFIKGPLNMGHVKAALQDKDCDYYFCGPTPFMMNMAKGLKEWGVPEKQINYEYFGPAP